MAKNTKPQPDEIYTQDEAVWPDLIGFILNEWLDTLLLMPATFFDMLVDRFKKVPLVGWAQMATRPFDLLVPFIATTILLSAVNTLSLAASEILRAPLVGSMEAGLEIVRRQIDYFKPLLRQRVMTLDEAVLLFVDIMGTVAINAVTGGPTNDLLKIWKLKKAVDNYINWKTLNVPKLIATAVIKQLIAVGRSTLLVLGTVFVLFILWQFYRILANPEDRRRLFSQALTQLNPRMTVRDVKARIRLGGTGR